MLTVAWTGIGLLRPADVLISVRPERHSHAIISRTGEFVINLTTRRLARAADWCGVRSGRDFDKFREMGLTAVPSEKVAAPLIAESPVNIECRVRQVLPLGTHDMFLAEVVGVQADEAYIDPATGRFCLDGPIRSSTPTASISRWARRWVISAGRCAKRKRRRRDADISDSLCFGVVTTLFPAGKFCGTICNPVLHPFYFLLSLFHENKPDKIRAVRRFGDPAAGGMRQDAETGDAESRGAGQSRFPPPDGIPLSLRR